MADDPETTRRAHYGIADQAVARLTVWLEAMRQQATGPAAGEIEQLRDLLLIGRRDGSVVFNVE